MQKFALPFAIGLSPLDTTEWLSIPADLEFYLLEKDRLHETHADQTFVAEPETFEAQREAQELLIDYLLDRHPRIYERAGETININGNRVLDLQDQPQPLKTAACLISDDLILMRQGPKGWHLAAGSLCFPSSWSLIEKFGLPMSDIHQPVPGFGPGTRNAMVIERIFDNLLPDQIVTRQNWSLYSTDTLYHPTHNNFDLTDDAQFVQNPFIRTERQTLRKLPVSGDILFTIGIEVRRMNDWAKSSGTKPNLKELANHIEQMSKEEAHYKGLTQTRSQLIETLRASG